MPEIASIAGGQGPPPSSVPDAYGQAALVLVESILHALVETKVLTIDEAIAAVEVAQETKAELGREANEEAGRLAESQKLLAAISISLAADLP